MFDELIVAKLLKKLPVFYETRVLITVFRISIQCNVLKVKFPGEYWRKLEECMLLILDSESGVFKDFYSLEMTDYTFED
jgi:hypothetical protein